jgi:hypothetical protein
VEPFPDLGSFSDADLERLIDELANAEPDGRIPLVMVDRLRAELRARLDPSGGTSVLEEPDGAT